MYTLIAGVLNIVVFFSSRADAKNSFYVDSFLCELGN